MSKTKRYLTLSQTAHRFGISGKALRIYEEKGLVRPERTSTDWRVYGPEQLLRLQQVIALKSFGLSLSRIAELLSGRSIDMAGFLALHESLLRRQKEEVDAAITLVAAARSRLARGDSLSSDDLIDLARKTSMTHSSENTSTYDAIAARHLSAEDQAVLAANGFAGMDQPDAAWDKLIAEATEVMRWHKPDSPRAMDLAKRWMEQVFKATGGDVQLNHKVRAVARDMLEQPAFQQQSQSSLEMGDYIAKAYGAAIEAGLMPRPKG